MMYLLIPLSLVYGLTCTAPRPLPKQWAAWLLEYKQQRGNRTQSQ